MATRHLTLLAVVLIAQPARAEPVLHEYVPPPGEKTVTPGVLPEQIRVDDRTLARPPTDPARAPEERVLDGGGQRMDRITADRTTTHDGTLRYRAEFNPSVVPFKRMTAMDAVAEGYALHVRDRTLTPVRVAKVPPSPDRDLFWGSLVLKLKPGLAVPVPSVAPGARVLSYTTTPSVVVRFFRDSADNYWVRSDRPVRGQLRLVFLTDAPRRYFSPQIPPLVGVSDVPRELRPKLPASVRHAAQRVIRQVGVPPRATLMRQLDRLVAYFRNFRPGPLPRITGDTYLDIALSQKGVCRHRSFAFVITAQALGIPARYVQNEAHAFTEVFVPRMGWARIDLGGASNELQVMGAKEKAVHSPGPDPFPSPSRYATGYSRLNQNVSGVRPSQRIRRSAYRVDLESYNRSSGSGGTRGTAAGAPAAAGAPPAPGAQPSEPGQEPAEGDPTAEPTAPGPSRRPTQIALHTDARSVYRGEQVSVWGRITAAGNGAAGLRVEIYLSQNGRVSDALLGATVSGPDGRFTVSLPVPTAVRVGQYRVYAATPGDQEHDASISR